MNKSLGWLGLILLVAGCRPSTAPSKNAGGEAHGHAHAHHAPHGGALTELGEEFAHVEVRVDAALGGIRLNLLDGESENPVRSKQTALSVTLKDGAALRLAAAANPLTGETVGDSSEFAGSSPALRGIDRLEAVLERVDVLGKSFENVTLHWPKGTHAGDEK
jgi:hypothetical protein